MEQFRLPKIPMPHLELPQAVRDILTEAEERLQHRPRLLAQFRNCFPNTLETTTKLLDDGTTFVITGDIPAMWLRDSVEQVMHYVPLAKKTNSCSGSLGGSSNGIRSMQTSISMPMRSTKRLMDGIGMRMMRQRCRLGSGNASLSWIHFVSPCGSPLRIGVRRN